MSPGPVLLALPQEPRPWGPASCVLPAPNAGDPAHSPAQPSRWEVGVGVLSPGSSIQTCLWGDALPSQGKDFGVTSAQRPGQEMAAGRRVGRDGHRRLGMS